MLYYNNELPIYKPGSNEDYLSPFFSEFAYNEFGSINTSFSAGGFPYFFYSDKLSFENVKESLISFYEPYVN